MGLAERLIIGAILIFSAYEIYEVACQRHHFHLLVAWSKCVLNYSHECVSDKHGIVRMPWAITKAIVSFLFHVRTVINSVFFIWSCHYWPGLFNSFQLIRQDSWRMAQLILLDSNEHCCLNNYGHQSRRHQGRANYVRIARGMHQAINTKIVYFICTIIKQDKFISPYYQSVTKKGKTGW